MILTWSSPAYGFGILSVVIAAELRISSWENVLSLGTVPVII